MQASQRLVKNTGVLYLRMAITVFFSLYTTRLVLKVLGPADFGIFNVVGGVIAMLGFLNTSMAVSTQRFMSIAQGSGDKEKVKRIFNTSTALHLYIGVVVVALFEIVGFFLFNGTLNIPADRIQIAKQIYQFSIISTFVTILSVPYEAVITSRENMVVYTVAGIIEAILKLAVALFLFKAPIDKLTLYGLLSALVTIFLLVGKRLYCHKVYEECVFNFKKYYDKVLLKEIRGFAGWSLLGSTSSMLAFYGQGLVMNVFFGTIVNAAQAVAAQVSGQLSVFAFTMQKALNPIIDKSAGRGDTSQLLRASIVGSKLSFLLLMLMFMPVLVQMENIFNFWLKSYPVEVLIFCKLLLMRNLVEQSYVTLMSTISAVGKIKKFQISLAFLNFAPIIITYFLYKLGYPSNTIYWVFLFVAIAKGMNVLYHAKVNCGLNVQEYFKNVILICWLTFLCAYGIMMLIGYLQLHAIVSIVAAFVVSLTCIWLIALTKDEKSKMHQTILFFKTKLTGTK